MTCPLSVTGTPPTPGSSRSCTPLPLRSSITRPVTTTSVIAEVAATPGAANAEMPGRAAGETVGVGTTSCWSRVGGTSGFTLSVGAPVGGSLAGVGGTVGFTSAAGVEGTVGLGDADVGDADVGDGGGTVGLSGTVVGSGAGGADVEAGVGGGVGFCITQLSA